MSTNYVKAIRIAVNALKVINIVDNTIHMIAYIDITFLAFFIHKRHVSHELFFYNVLRNSAFVLISLNKGHDIHITTDTKIDKDNHLDNDSLIFTSQNVVVICDFGVILIIENQIMIVNIDHSKVALIDASFWVIFAILDLLFIILLII